MADDNVRTVPTIRFPPEYFTLGDNILMHSIANRFAERRSFTVAETAVSRREAGTMHDALFCQHFTLPETTHKYVAL
jgi:hypothetical protein